MRIPGVVALVVTAVLITEGRPEGLHYALSAAPAQTLRAKPRRPKLLVILVVDQLRADYIDKFRHQWTRGLRRLVDRGAWFRQSAYPYLNTVTCSGHATIGTGSLPASHGMILNAWWDRATKRQTACTEDPAAPIISYGGPVKGGDSAVNLIVPTLTDELRVQVPGSRVVTLSMKARSAIMLGGRQPNAVTWFEGDNWVTSTAFAKAPVPAVQAFVAAHPVVRDAGKSWTKTLPEAAYIYSDEAAEERAPKGWTRAFPHALGGTAGKADELFLDLWERTPFADDYLARMAAEALRSFALGQRDATDFLGISFSSLDRIGHDFGPRSHEVQDVLARLDVTIGSLLNDLDRMVGAGNYVVALSADHGVSPIPEQMQKAGVDAGRITTKEATDRLEKALADVLGPGKYVASMQYTDTYFQPGVYDRMVANPAAMNAAIDALLATPGVWRVYRSDELRHRPASDDALTRAAAASYFHGRSGDLITIPKPYWILASAGATHGTAHAYDQRVPVLLAGAGIRAGEYMSAASPADIAPTLAFLAGVTLARPDGRVLAEALVPASQSRPVTARPPLEW